MSPRLLLAAAVAFAAVEVPAVSAATLDLKRVMLSSGGVGYFEYEAAVTGDDTLSLEVRLDQVDDILKSLVVYDDRGAVVSVGLQSREPLGQLLRDLPFDPRALDTPKALFNTLQGAELKVGSPKPMTGRILKADDEITQLRDGQTTTRTRVSLMTASGLQQFVLEDADAVGFVDPALQAKLADALGTIARHHDGGRRTLVLQTRGSDARTVRVGYVVGAPLWKASYRMTLGTEPTARLQGWAVLENTTGSDWKDVELTLLSGNPVTFRQALYESYYVQRPSVPVEVVGRVLPKQDEGAVMAGSATEAARPRSQAMGVPAAPAPLRGAPPMLGEYRAADAGVMAPVVAAELSEGGTQVAFKLPQPVSIGSGRSAVVPLLDRAMPAARVALLQAGAASPLAAVQLTNDGTTGLPPGVLTLYERAADGTAAYVGDARLATFPIGEQRLLSYAVDGKLRVDRSTGMVDPIAAASLSDGVLKLTRKQRQTTTYRLAAPMQEPRRVIIEQPRLPGWSLTDPDPAGVTMTREAYRIAAELKPGESRTVAVTLEMPIQETVRLLDLDDARLGALVSARELDTKLRDVLAELARRRQALAQQRVQRQTLQAERDALVQDQARVRDNLNTVPKGTPLYNRLIDKLGDEETRIDALAGAITAATAEIDKAAAALSEHVNKLTL